MTLLRDEKAEPQRWTIYQKQLADGVVLTQTAGAGLPWGTSIEVMPVSEHRENCDRHERFVEELILDRERLRDVAEKVFDTAGKDGIALINLGLVLAGEEPNTHV